MEAYEAKIALLKAASIWFSQPTDSATAGVWAESLGRVSVRGALDAIRAISDSGQHDPPTCGEIYKLAVQFDQREDDLRRRERLALDEIPGDAERAENLQMLRDLIARIESRGGRKRGGRAAAIGK